MDPASLSSPMLASYNLLNRQASISDLPSASAMAGDGAANCNASKRDNKYSKKLNKATRAKRCKSLLMLSSPFSHSLMNLLNPTGSSSASNTSNSSSFSSSAINTSASSSSASPTNSSSGSSCSQDQVDHATLSRDLIQQKQQQQARKPVPIKMKLFEQPLDKLFCSKTLKQFEKENSSPSSSSPSSFSLIQLRRKRNSASNYAKTTTNSPSLTSICADSNSKNLRRTFSSSTSTDANNNFQNSHNDTITKENLLIKEQQLLLLAMIPEPIKNLLNELYLRGPETVGIFRKSPNAKHCKELRHKLETDSHSPIDHFQVTVIASVFKEWLRSLPDCLLMSRLYPQWIDVAKLIEPLHQNQLLQQQQQSPQSLDESASSASTATIRSSTILNDTVLAPTNRTGGSHCNTTVTTAPNSSPTDSTRRSPLTDSAQAQLNNHLLPIERTLSCSTVTSECSINDDIKNLEIGDDDAFEPASNYCSPVHTNASTSNNLIRHQNRQKFGLIKSLSTSLTPMASSNMNYIDGVGPTTMSAFALSERHSECLRIIRQLLDTMNKTNLIIMRSFICVLWHIANNSEHNKMSAANLGVCVGQSLLNDEHQSASGAGGSSSLMAATSGLKSGTSTFTKRHRRTKSHCLLTSTLSLTSSTSLLNQSPTTNGCGFLATNCAQETAKYVPILVAFMIENAPAIFGDDIKDMFSYLNSQKQSRQIEQTNEESDLNLNLPQSNTNSAHKTGAAVVAEVKESAKDMVSDGNENGSSAKTNQSLVFNINQSLASGRDQVDHGASSGALNGNNDSTQETNVMSCMQSRNHDTNNLEATSVIIINNSPNIQSQQPQQLSTRTTTNPSVEAQRRPLSATESTSSSRASSSTSGVHSDSPVFSNDVDSLAHNSSSMNSNTTGRNYTQQNYVNRYSTRTQHQYQQQQQQPVFYSTSNFQILQYRHRQLQQQQLPQQQQNYNHHQQQYQYQLQAQQQQQQPPPPHVPHQSQHHYHHHFHHYHHLQQPKQQHQHQHQHDQYLMYHQALLKPQRSHVMSLRDYYLSLQNNNITLV